MSHVINILKRVFPLGNDEFGNKDWGKFVQSIENAGYRIDITKKEETEYETEMFCPNCGEHTEHLVHGSFHERDSSGELYTCLTCHWWASGYDGGNEYKPTVDN